MDRIAEWRPVDPAGPDGPADSSADEPSEVPASKQARPAAGWHLFAPALLLLSVAGLIVAGAIGLVAVAGMPAPAVAIDASASPRSPSYSTSGPRTDTSSTLADQIVVDVEGAVENPGVWRIPAGSRVGDAIAVAGGYSPQVDIAAASAALNLAASITDGEQIHVPVRGEASLSAAPVATGPATGNGGLIDINSATAEELDTLPGIGPVTAAKIIDIRPFGTLDALLSGGVVGQSTFDKIKSLITVGP